MLHQVQCQVAIVFVHQRIPWRIGNRTLPYSDLRQFTFYLTSNFNVSHGVLSGICSFFVGIISGIQFLSSIVFNKYVTYSSGHIFWHVISGSIWYKFWQFFWHSIWQSVCHTIWHLLWHSNGIDIFRHRAFWHFSCLGSSRHLAADQSKWVCPSMGCCFTHLHFCKLVSPINPCSGYMKQHNIFASRWVPLFALRHDVVWPYSWFLFHEDPCKPIFFQWITHTCIQTSQTMVLNFQSNLLYPKMTVKKHPKYHFPAWKLPNCNYKRTDSTCTKSLPWLKQHVCYKQKMWDSKSSHSQCHVTWFWLFFCALIRQPTTFPMSRHENRHQVRQSVRGLHCAHEATVSQAVLCGIVPENYAQRLAMWGPLDS